MDKRECLQQLLTKGRQRLSQYHSRARQLDGLKGILFMRRDIACQAVEKQLTQLQARLMNIIDQRLAQIEQLCAEKEVHISSEKTHVLKLMSTLTQICSRSTDFLQFGNEELCKTKDCEDIILSFEKILEDNSKWDCPRIEEKHINLSYVPLLPDDTVTLNSVGMLKTSRLDPRSIEIERCRDKPREVSLCGSAGLSLFIKTSACSLTADDLEIFSVKVTDSNNVSKPVTVAVCVDQPSKLQVTFSPTFPEAYQLTVKLYDTHVMNSPYKFSVRNDFNKTKCSGSKSDSVDSGNLSISQTQMSSETDSTNSRNCGEPCKACNLSSKLRLKFCEPQKETVDQNCVSAQNSSNVSVPSEKLPGCDDTGRVTSHSHPVNDLEYRDNTERSSRRSRSGNCTEKRVAYRSTDSPDYRRTTSADYMKRSQSDSWTEKQDGRKSTDLPPCSGRAASVEHTERSSARSQNGNSGIQANGFNNSGALSRSRSAQTNCSSVRSNGTRRFSPRSSDMESNNKTVGQARSAQRNIVNKASINDLQIYLRTQCQDNSMGNSFPSELGHSQDIANQKETFKPPRAHGGSPNNRAGKVSPGLRLAGRNECERFEIGQTSTPRVTNSSPAASQNTAGISEARSKCEEALSYSSSMTDSIVEKSSADRLDLSSEPPGSQHNSYAINKEVPSTNSSVNSGIRREQFNQRAVQSNGDHMCTNARTVGETPSPSKTKQANSFDSRCSSEICETTSREVSVDKEEQTSGRNSSGKVMEKSRRNSPGCYEPSVGRIFVEKSPGERDLRNACEKISEKRSPGNHKQAGRKHSPYKYEETCGRNVQSHLEHILESGQPSQGNFEDTMDCDSRGSIEQTRGRNFLGDREDVNGKNSVSKITQPSGACFQGNPEDTHGNNAASSTEQASGRNFKGSVDDTTAKTCPHNIEQATNRNFQGIPDDTSVENGPYKTDDRVDRNPPGNTEQSGKRDVPEDRVKLKAKRCLTPTARTTQAGIYISVSRNHFRTGHGGLPLTPVASPSGS